MRRALLALLLMVAVPAWAAEPRDLSWQEMIPPDAPVEVPNMTPLHDLSNMADALSAEAAPAAGGHSRRNPPLPEACGSHLLLTYFSRRIIGIGRPMALSASKLASTMSGLPHR